MDSRTRTELEAELDGLQRELAERKASVPIHSIRPHQLIEIEELEEKIEEIQRQLAEGQTGGG